MSAKGRNLRLIEVPVVTDALPQIAAAIHITVMRSEIRSVMGPGLGEIIKTVKAHSIGPTGPWLQIETGTPQLCAFSS